MAAIANCGHILPVTAVIVLDPAEMLYDFNVLKRILGYWPYIFIAIALVGLVYAVWIRGR